MEKFINKDFKITEDKIDKILGIGKSFDLLKKNVTIGERKAALYYINGFVKKM